MHGDILTTIVIATFLGILAQVIAHWRRLPAILPLLIFGMAAGPQGLHFFDPKVLGHGLEVFIHLGVAVILFEGGLSLDPSQLRQAGGPIRNLLTTGVVVTWVGATWLAVTLIDAPLSVALLFGAIVTVTGPTVIAPLLRHMIAPQRVRTILVSEGLIIDGIGAVLAYFVLLWIERSGLQLTDLLVDILKVGLFGSMFGFVAGSLAKGVARARHFPAELRNLIVLALLFMSYMLSESLAKQSGIVAAVVMGLTLSAATVPDLVAIKSFKGQLTVFLISILFILLSGQLDLNSILDLGWGGALVTAGLILLVRPASVFISMPGRAVPWREKVMLGLTAPRGIVAAAVASLSAIQLADLNIEGSELLEGLVYLTILVTCTWATIMASVLPRLLGYVDDPSRRQVVLVGAHPLSVALAQMLQENEWMCKIVDADRAKLVDLRDKKIRPVRGDARDAATYEKAGVERDTRVLVLTTNDELNLLVAEVVRNEFDVEHPVAALQTPSDELGTIRHAWLDLFGGGPMDVQEWNYRLSHRQAGLHTFDFAAQPQLIPILRTILSDEEDDDFVLVCGWDGDKPFFPPKVMNLEQYDRLTVLIDPRAAAELEASAVTAAEPVEEEGSDEVDGHELQPAT